MPEVIQFLSDHIANQIAAGEVIQRPASAIKELLENSIDASATAIQIVIKDAGKELIQVIDDGCGMSPIDARMSFERHATSKIKKIEDLFHIRTMGFRGEALASVAAVAQVEMRTRKSDSELGTRICVEGTEVKVQEPCSTSTGTNLMIKNLFYNVPARRHFLKSNTTEFRHIMDELTRVAMANHDVAFRLWNGSQEQLNLPGESLKSRIVGLLGASLEKNLVPVEEVTELLTIRGFVGKPAAATRTRGNQFFFINNRFIRSPFLHHAVASAFEGMIDKEAVPFYVLFLETDPARVDVNVHPTKQEVKFDDEKMMYAYMSAAVKHSLARYNISPSLDFTLDNSITSLPAVNGPQGGDAQHEQARQSFLHQSYQRGNQAHLAEQKHALKEWKELYRIAERPAEQENAQITMASGGGHSGDLHALAASQQPLLVQGSLLLTTVKSGIMLIHIRRAQERIWFERLLSAWTEGNTPSQQMLFPITYPLSPQDAPLLERALPDMGRIGFDIAPFGHGTFIIRGTPMSLPAGDEKALLDEVVEHLKNEGDQVFQEYHEKLLAHMARRLSWNKQGLQTADAQQALIDELFACAQPSMTPDGKTIFTMIRKEELDAMLGS